jgi:hypothetical protein
MICPALTFSPGTIGFWFWQVRSLRPDELAELVLVGVVDDDPLASAKVTVPRSSP